jgi:multicomponent Na+:H+ antiporter subunit A
MPFYIVITAVLIAVSAFLITMTGSRMAAVVLLGVTGYGIALVYMFYGGIDLAITQILIETLTVILFVLVIRKLPKFKTLSSIPSRMRDISIAVFFGVVMTGLTLKAGIVNMSDPISEFFVEKSLPEGFGKNIVNVILVDFRALDTLGEITVLTIAAVGVLVLLKFKMKT